MRKIDLILKQVQIFALYLFLFSINFEVWDPLSTDGNFSVSKLTGLVYLATITPHLKKFIRTDIVDYIMWPIWLFFSILTLVSLININSMSYYFFDFSIFQNMFLLLFMLNHARKEPLVLEKGMLSFAFGSISLALLFYVGIGIEYEAGRVTLFGDNANIIGIRMCIAMTVLILAIVQNRLKLRKLRYLFFLPMPLMLQFMFQTGSRVATIAFGLMFMVGLVLFKTKNIWRKIALFAVGSMVFVYGLNVMMQSETLVHRFLKTSGEGDLAGREVIWQKLFTIIQENPIFGVGKTGYDYYSQTNFGQFTSPHNVFLEVLCYTGIVGLGIYLFFLYRIFNCGYQSFKTERLLLPLLLIVVVLGLLVSGQILNVKIGWIIFAYISGTSIFKFNPETSMYRSCHI